MPRRIMRIAVCVITAVSLFGGATVTASSGATPSLARAPGPTVAAPTTVTQGRTFLVRGRKHAAPAGWMLLQRRVPGGRWHTSAHKRVTRLHPVAVFSRKETRLGKVWFRVRLGHLISPRDEVTVRRPPTVLLMDAGTTGPDDIFVGDTYDVSGHLTRGNTPLVGRSVTVRRMLPGETDFSTVGTFVTDRSGSFTFKDSSPTRGLVEYQGSVGSVTGFVDVPVFEVVSMPAARGPRLTVTDNVTGSCRAGVAGNGDIVRLRLTGQSTAPACTIQGGDFINVQWDLPGTCTPVRVDNMRLANGPGANSMVQIRLWVEDAPDPLVDDDLAEGQGTGGLTISGDPVSTINVRMNVIGSSGNYVGALDNVHATCL